MNEIKEPNEKELIKAINNVNNLLTKSYLSELTSSTVIESELNDINSEDFLNKFNEKVRFFDITQIVLNKNENMRDKLATVFNAVGCTGASILMRIAGTTKKVSIEFGIRNSDLDQTELSYEVLEKTLLANFPGSVFKNLFKTDLKEQILDSIPSNCVISTITDIPALRFKEESKERQFMQGIEKLIDTLRDESYTILLIADPISQNDLKVNKTALENIYSSLVPFSEAQYTTGENESESLSKSTTENINNSISTSVSHTVGTSGSVGFWYGVSGNISTNKSNAKSNGFSKSEGTSTTDGTSSTIGYSKSKQIKIENHTIKQIMKRIDETLKRYDNCIDLGMWNCAVYCISSTEYVSKMAASVYHSLIRGEKSSLEDGAVTTWNKEQSKAIINSLKQMTHPIFSLDGIGIVTPGTLISSSELAIATGLPNHSVPGIPVIECAEFGRTVSTYDESEEARTITLGNIYNMHAEEKLPVKLNIDSLSSHVFITGSTGSGKSNTVYQILDSLKQNEVKFLVIEPAKGEYKYVFGQDETNVSNCDVHVYGTNQNISSLLRINPFSFPHSNEDASKNIHILEHLDRLIEIFNVCWPMYAAMPAVLKNAVEKSYEDCGWNLINSTNEYGENFYPTFADVTRNIKDIIENSEYDKENKGAYKGSLITRLESLTNGINGLLFTTNEITSKELFDENVIIDLSRVGSTETKSLIMGLLILKLQEYRMTSGNINANLKHVTILEEAHNLLKRTSNEQSQESGNLLGKSVEMLTNSIAEMRTYGEGFIIADQAPALLDMAVIRNTNTKIIMRLPDQGDRELVGKAANLNEEQIKELAKLPRGVAAVYQNEWVESVLCKISFFKPSNTKYCKSITYNSQKELNIQQKIDILNLLFYGKDLPPTTISEINDCNLSARSKVIIQKWQKDSTKAPEFVVTSSVVSELFKEFSATLKNTLKTTPSKQTWTDDVNKIILDTLDVQNNSQLRIDINQAIMTEVLLNEFNRTEDYFDWYKGDYLR
jgi:DNA helicase HerA-like ATPase